MGITPLRPSLVAGISLTLLALSHLGWPPGHAARQAPAMPSHIAAERALASVVTVYAERAASAPVMIAAGPEAFDEDANRQAAPEGWSWRSGSGFAVAPGGYVLTNHHVIADARRIEARLADGRRVSGELVGSDPLTDLALVRVGVDLPVMEWGDESHLHIGQRVFAIGSPLDFHHSVSAGVVGGFARAYDGSDPVSYLQHDAALNPGNSGGPLIDEAGRVIGVNTAIPQEAFFNVGISLAVPAQTARAVTEALLHHGRVERGYLGVSVRTLHGPLASALGRENGQGVLVEAVDPGSPADQAGLRPGDALLSVDRTRLSVPRDLARALLGTRPGEEVALSVHDGQARIQLSAVLQARRELPTTYRQRDLGHRADRPAGFGITLSDVDGAAGLPITDIVPGSPAARAGLRPGDRVLSVGTSVLGDAGEAMTRLLLARGDVALRVMRAGEGEPRFIALSYAPGGAGHAPDHTAFADAAGGPF
ncbi:MAG: trypsin-like peptidase domain-containing protein [Oceanicaulis sp.]|uniref:trypsin-like peptidase domain-containing protein n=1 Tax=Glycocaulis sp. TaxID=1969725 RepID=UPI0025C2DF0A|nr:trypsin-like peptidase domain-containing protein [Glycocaulis sp.]MCC5982276.1 trypsin-like peptidase domain-containing protein [Oceanicaulis sp.]MCH8520733.1 trypsin-like peptidase domain-containing protein [Glycocaulis sp.]